MTEQKANEHILTVAQEREGIIMAHYEDHPVIKKKGQYGVYLRWKEVTLPFVEGESPASLQERLQQKTGLASSPAPSPVLKETAHYQVRTGPYGAYMMKKATASAAKSAGKKSIFVSVPKGLDIAPLTDKEIGALYQAGLEAKKNRPLYPSIKERVEK